MTHGKAFRTALLAIVADKAINEKVKPQMIQTLCALQMEKEETIDLFSALNPEDEKFKAINALLTLKLENPTAYEWAFRDDLLGIEFRKVLLAIVHDPAINDEVQPRIIQTLYLLQMEKKNSFELYSKMDDELGKKFRQAILKIENNCQQIKTRLDKEAPEKAKEFGKAEQEYRKGLYDAVYDTLKNKPTQEKFEANIEESSKPMLAAVDPDRHPWLRRAMMVLTNILNVIYGTAPARLSVGRTFFYQHTTSGTEVRNLHQDLTKDFQNEFKAHKKELQDFKESDKEKSIGKGLLPFNK